MAMKTAWENMKESSNLNCYRKVEFVKENVIDEEDVKEPKPNTSSNDEHDLTGRSEGNFRKVWDNVRSVYGNMICNLDEYVECDHVADIQLISLLMN